MNIEYPQEFIKETKKMFPNDAKLHIALDTGDVAVGSYLLNRSVEINNMVDRWCKIFGSKLGPPLKKTKI